MAYFKRAEFWHRTGESFWARGYFVSTVGLDGVVAPLWLRAKSAYGGGRGMFEHEVSQALPVQAREAEEVPRSQLGGIQRRAAPPGRFDSLV